MWGLGFLLMAVFINEVPGATLPDITEGVFCHSGCLGICVAQTKPESFGNRGSALYKAAFWHTTGIPTQA